MESRTRSRTRYASTGLVLEKHGGVLQEIDGPFNFIEEYQESHDFIGKHRRTFGKSGLEPSPLEILKETFSPTTVSIQEIYNDGVNQEFRNVPLASSLNRNWQPPEGWAYWEGSNTELVAKLLADTNPFKYTVSIPIMISELVEASTLLSLATNNFASLVGSAYLNNEFGIETFMSDVKSLSEIISTIESKLKELNSLIKVGGLRRRKFLKSKTIAFTDKPEVGWSGYSKNFEYKHVITFRTKVWGSVRWRPRLDQQINYDKLTSVNNAIRIVLDLKSPDWSTIWEMIPFSWLVDYFVDFGDVLQAIEKSDVVEPYDICIMRHRTIESRMVGLPSNVYNNADWYPYRSYQSVTGRHKFDFKLRYVAPDDPSAAQLLSFGFLSKGQALNLTALLLSLTRFRRSWR